MTDNRYSFQDREKFYMMLNVGLMFMRTQSQFYLPVKVLFSLLEKSKNLPSEGKYEFLKVGSD